MFLDSNQWKLSKLLAEDEPTRAIQPAVENGRIDPSEIDGVTGIAVLKVGEVGISPVQSGPNTRPGDEYRQSGAVIGSPAGIFGQPAAELREGKQDHTLVFA